MKIDTCFLPADILLPDFSVTDGTKWSVVACDQFTSQEDYWKETEQTVGDAPSTLRLMLPEIYLSQSGKRIEAIHKAMKTALAEQLICHSGSMIYLERVQSDGSLRHGVVGAVDLEQYDYRKGSSSLIRATEGTVLERIPPRVAVRRGAALELPHVMLLCDDPENRVMELAAQSVKQTRKAYDFDLMQNGGHVTGYFMDASVQGKVVSALSELITPAAMKAKYGDGELSPLLFAVGDGNHSLASAKAYYEELKEELGEEAARKHPARYALCEVVNLHDSALQFEPIYRIVYGADEASLTEELKRYLSALSGSAEPQTLTVVTPAGETVLTVKAPESQLAVGTLQNFLDGYLKAHPEAEPDYIHGEQALRTLVSRRKAVGFLFGGMKKEELFRTVLYDGSLPRKTFSMGHAEDKRYYLECRKITD